MKRMLLCTLAVLAVLTMQAQNVEKIFGLTLGQTTQQETETILSSYNIEYTVDGDAIDCSQEFMWGGMTMNEALFLFAEEKLVAYIMGNENQDLEAINAFIPNLKNQYSHIPQSDNMIDAVLRIGIEMILEEIINESVEDLTVLGSWFLDKPQSIFTLATNQGVVVVCYDRDALIRILFEYLLQNKDNLGSGLKDLFGSASNEEDETYDIFGEDYFIDEEVEVAEEPEFEMTDEEFFEFLLAVSEELDRQEMIMEEVETDTIEINTETEQDVEVASAPLVKVPVVEEEEEEIVFIVVETMPEFPGGTQAMMTFIGENIKYPLVALENGIQGRVICQFVVEKDGMVTDIQVVRSSGNDSLDQEAIRVINNMPKWKPGKQRGKPVRVKYTIPINFRLQDNTEGDISQDSAIKEI